MKKLSDILEQNKVVPASAKVDKIDNQWLEPASHDKKVVAGMTEPTDTMDTDDFQDDNFSAGKNLSKDKSKAKKTTSDGNPAMPAISESRSNTLSRIMGRPTNISSTQRADRDRRDHKFAGSIGGDSSNYKDGDKKQDKDGKKVNESVDDLVLIYSSEAWEMFDQIESLLGEYSNHSAYRWQEIANCLRTTRDLIVRALPSEDQTAVGVAEQAEQIDEVLPVYLSSKFRKLARFQLSKAVKASKKIVTPGQSAKVGENAPKDSPL